MRTLAVTLLTSALLAPAVPAVESASDLERRAAEQERQIRSLEVENELLRAEIDRLRARLHASEEGADTATQATADTTRGTAAGTPPTPAAEASEGRIHVVRAGESLSTIARLYDTTTDQLVELNDIRNPSLIREGQKLKVPEAAAGTTATTTAPESPGKVEGTHHVKSGETFYSIAGIYGLSVESLRAANPDVDPRALRVGQELKLSARKVEPSAEPGDSGTGGSPDPSAEPTSEGPPTGANGPSVRLVPIDETMTFGEFARRHRMNPEKLNALNGLHLEPKRVLATGSQLYVSAQPLQ